METYTYMIPTYSNHGMLHDVTVYDVIILIFLFRHLDPPSIICYILCSSWQESFAPFKGHARLSELGIEQGFGELRRHSPNSQLSARSFAVASAGRTLREIEHALTKQGSDPKAPAKGEPAVTEKRFLDYKDIYIFLFLGFCIYMTYVCI